MSAVPTPTLFDAAMSRLSSEGVRSFRTSVNDQPPRVVKSAHSFDAVNAALDAAGDPNCRVEAEPELDYSDAGRELYERLACFQRIHGEEYADVAWQYLPKVQRDIFNAAAMSLIEWAQA
jgi:hypothetical protein